MVTSEDRLKVLKMLQDGIIDAEAAMKLLDALEVSESATRKKTSAWPQGQPTVSAYSGSAAGRGRMLQIRVTDIHTGKPKANIRVPVNAVKAGAGLGMRFSPGFDEKLDLDALMMGIEEGMVGLILDVTEESTGERVEISIE